VGQKAGYYCIGEGTIRDKLVANFVRLENAFLDCVSYCFCDIILQYQQIQFFQPNERSKYFFEIKN